MPIRAILAASAILAMAAAVSAGCAERGPGATAAGCAARYSRRGAQVTIAVQAAEAATLVVSATAPGSVLRFEDPAFAGADTLTVPSQAVGTITVTVKAKGTVRGCPVRAGTVGTGSPPARALGPRVLAIGDSLTAQAAAALTDELAQRQAVTLVMGVSGSGLVSGFDWLAPAATLVAGFHPTVAVAEFIGNYPDPKLTTAASGSPVAAGTDPWVATWMQQADRLTGVLRAGGGRVGWVLGPPMLNPAIDAVVDRLNSAYAARAAPPTIELIDEHTPFADAEHNFTATAEQSPVLIRTPDGVHLADGGCRLWAETMARRLHELAVVG